MLLSQAIYLSIKQAIYYDDSSFTYDNFIRGKFDGDPDYSTNINNVFSPFNQAIAELSDLERIPYRVEEIEVEDSAFNVSSLSRNLKEIVGIGYFDGTQLVSLNWKKLGDVIRIPRIKSGSVYVEYKELIPYFGFDEYTFYYNYIDSDNDGVAETLDSYRDFDLKDYHLTDNMCVKIAEYVKGVLGEPVSAELANMHVTRAMQLFADIDPVKSSLNQERVQTVYKIWW